MVLRFLNSAWYFLNTLTVPGGPRTRSFIWCTSFDQSWLIINLIPVTLKYPCLSEPLAQCYIYHGVLFLLGSSFYERFFLSHELSLVSIYDYFFLLWLRYNFLAKSFVFHFTEAVSTTNSTYLVQGPMVNGPFLVPTTLPNPICTFT